MIFTSSRKILMKNDVQRPMTLVLDRPVRPDNLQHARRCKFLGQSEGAHRMHRLTIDLPPIVDARHSSKPRKFAALARFASRNNDGAAEFEAAMPVFGC